MGSIRKRAGRRGVRWQVQVRSCVPPITRTFDKYAKAKAFERRAEKAVADQRSRGVSARLLGHAISRYMDTALGKLADSTRVSSERLLGWWYEHHGTAELDSLTKERLVEIRDALVAERDEHGAPLRGPSTVNRYMTALSAVLTKAADEWAWIPRNPLGGLKRLGEPKGRVRFLEREEIAALLAACDEQRGRPGLRLYAAIALYTALRQGEVLGLRWRDVDLKRRLIVLHNTKNGERRGIPISLPLLAELRAHQRRTDTDLLFPMPSDPTRSSRHTWRRAWAAALEAAGIADFHYHDTRHTAASHLAMAGATNRELQDILGHKSLSMVPRYAHLSPAHVAGVIDRLGDAIAPEPQQREEEPHSG